MATIKRPTLFHHGAYAWVIKYFNVDNEDHGKTDYDNKEIHIFTKNKDEASIRDTVLHEIEHVLNEDIFKTIKMMCSESNEVEDIEEQYVLLTTPRRMLTYSSNVELLTYLFNYKQD